MAKNRWILLGVVLLAFGGGWFGWRAYRASRDLVTLNVRNMAVRQVCRLLEKQTWETIHVGKPVEGRVTLNVKDVPLEEVLNIVAEQVSARWTAVYPLYTTRASLQKLEQIVLGEHEDLQGWQAWRRRATPFGPGMFGEALREENKLVTVQLVDRDLDFAALALGRFAKAQIVPEDGVTNKVRLLLRNATMPEAVDQLARQTRRRWTSFYTLQGGGFGRGRGPREGGATNLLAAVPDSTNQAAFPFGPEGWRRGRGAEGDSNAPAGGPADGGRAGMMTMMLGGLDKQLEAQAATGTAEEQKRAQEMRQKLQELSSLPPDQQREKMREFFQSPEMQQRMQQMGQQRMNNNIKNTTPEQRVERTQRILEMRQRFQNRNP